MDFSSVTPLDVNNKISELIVTTQYDMKKTTSKIAVIIKYLLKKKLLFFEFSLFNFSSRAVSFLNIFIRCVYI